MAVSPDGNRVYVVNLYEEKRKAPLTTHVTAIIQHWGVSVLDITKEPISFENIAVNRQVGTFTIEITEGSEGSPTRTIDVTKFDNFMNGGHTKSSQIK